MKKLGIILAAIIVVIATLSFSGCRRPMNDVINSGRWGELHCQGMTMDKEKRYVYYSFTTKLVKTDVYGNIIGSVDRIVGHLGVH